MFLGTTFLFLPLLIQLPFNKIMWICTSDGQSPLQNIKSTEGILNFRFHNKEKSKNALQKPESTMTLFQLVSKTKIKIKAYTFHREPIIHSSKKNTSFGIFPSYLFKQIRSNHIFIYGLRA